MKKMENMMGGEGSPTLDNMYRLLGYRYLRFGRNDVFPCGGMIVTVIVLAARRKPNTNLEIMKSRLAKGDITEDEYEKLKAELK